MGEEVILQRILEGVEYPPPPFKVLSNTLLWDENGHHKDFSEPLIHMYNKSLKDAPSELKQLISGRPVGVLCGDGMGDLTMAEGHETTEVLKVRFLNEGIEARLPRYVERDAWDRVIVGDGSY